MSLRTVTTIITLLLCVFGLNSVLVACGGNAVKPTSLSLQYLPASQTFQTALGWNVQIGQANLSLSTVRLYAGKVAYAWHRPENLKQWAQSLSPWREAWAHPGHYEEGSVKAELAVQQKLSLVGEKYVPMGVMNAFTGTYGSGEIVFQQGNTLLLEGTTSKDGMQQAFRVELPLTESSVQGIAATYEVSSQPTTVKLRIHLERWFELIDFQSALHVPTSGKNAPATFHEAALNILRKAILSTANYSFQWESTGT